jgi:hypothetical protein
MLCHFPIFVLCTNRWMVTSCVTPIYVLERFGYGEFPKELCIFINFIVVQEFNTYWIHLDMGRNQWINLTTYYRSRDNKDVSWASHFWNPRALLLLSLYSIFEEVPSSFVPSISLLCFARSKELCSIFFFLLPWCFPIVPMCDSLIYCKNYEEFSDMSRPIDGSQYMCHSSPKLPHTPLAKPCYVNDKEKGLHEPNLLWLFRHNLMAMNTYTKQTI